jgi:multisubunit Na+/H+ antiporter MnhE subunit
MGFSSLNWGKFLLGIIIGAIVIILMILGDV